MRRTRILSTIGPASSDPDTIHALLAAGTDAFRLNFSHGTPDAHAESCRRIRAAASWLGRSVAILQDLAGPKIRIGRLEAPLTLRAGGTLTLAHGQSVGAGDTVYCSFDALFTSVGAGDRLLLDDGRIELEVTGTAPGALAARVIVGGVLESNKGINVPGAVVQTSSLTAKDADDLAAGVAMGVDLVAVSFVQSAEDLRAVRAAAAAAGAPDLPLIAKIEKPRAVERLAEILDAADGLMVARGDLGIEMPLEQLPAVQKKIILEARSRGVPVIVATQVLESMRSAPRPTRAEVTDAAHAVDEGADAIMLAGETAVGQYPVRAVQTLDAIIREAEKGPGPVLRVTPEGRQWSEHGRALCEAAAALAERARAGAIVAVTEAGNTARILAALRPEAHILAATPSAATAARLALVWGVTPVIVEHPSIAAVRDALLTRGLVPVGETIVYVSIQSSLGREDANFVHVEKI